MSEVKWPRQRTAVLVLHGIGSQFPFETLDMFTRPLVEELGRRNPGAIKLEHRVQNRSGLGVKGWKENSIRITGEDASRPIDVYEYYWANLSENMVSLKDLQEWVSQVVAGAKEFYTENRKLGEEYHDKSRFFDEEGRLRDGVYKSFIFAAFGIVPMYTATWTWLSKASGSIPWVGWLVKIIADQCNKKITDTITNYVGDVAVYNSLDPKSSFYKIRTDILEGAVSALRHIVEMREATAADSPAAEGSPYYGRIIVAGHSLGSQIAFDAINRLTRLISLGEIAGVAKDGKYIDSMGNPQPFVSGMTTLSNINETLCGLVTFGSPLDKIAFFLRQQAPKEQYLRCQILENYHSFKQRPWYRIDENRKKIGVEYDLPSPFERIFDDMRWYNFHDSKDPVSGHLDYYDKVHNVHMDYAKKKEGIRFSHAEYWKDPDMFAEIIDRFIAADAPVVHE